MDDFRPSLPNDARKETRDRLMEERIREFLETLPEQWVEFLRATMEEEDTGMMPMPPDGMGGPMLTPPRP